ncbi:hypothetical protein PARPLA_02785 [Rhodobacteraceae bacterium THAF1]|uniref:hypothetical protein n=1 Tax=Palleronia sp. THAF1 TaxID=2587842 RepID=UPI000F3C8944|nr:hypothetical protein [Palleronia sp. THAF1]QFU08189.1 hypothetical protein FIU81_05835 [Palleronia sp. THAF1]VDC28743.1 hypothetical protein PARPLA_02785 [Rhodobacteraceae bacterium THAF1]
MNSIISMAGRMLVRTLMKRGINAGLNKTLGPGNAPDQMTPEDRAKRQQSAQNVKRARKGMRIARRFGRF